MGSAEVAVLPIPSDLHYHYYLPSLVTKYGIGPFTIDKTHEKLSELVRAHLQPDVSADVSQAPCAQDHSKSRLPSEWPEQVEGPLVWKESDFPGTDAFTYWLNGAELEEIDRALNHVKACKVSFSAVGQHQFPLPILGPVLHKLSIDIHQGLGFAILKGIHSSKYTREENVYIYLGISSYIGPIRGRLTPRGDKLSHVVQAPAEAEPENGLGPVFSNSAQPFHADVGTDIVALYCLQNASRGGRTMVSSAWTVYNELARTRPDILLELASQDWVHNTFGHYPPFFKRPLMFIADGKPIFNFSQRTIIGSSSTPRDPRAPPVSEAQLNALEIVQSIARENCLALEAVKGDMMFLNNFGLLHAREAFENDGVSRRHLLRLWIHNDELGWKIPEGLKLQWENLFEDSQELEEKWNIEPDFGHPPVLGKPGKPRTSYCG